MKIATNPFKLRAAIAGIVFGTLCVSVAMADEGALVSTLDRRVRHRSRLLEDTPECTTTILNFSEVQDIVHVFDELWSTHCVNITAVADGEEGFTPIAGVHEPSGGAARIYDTEDQKNCEGPTEIEGGDLGKVLIIQKKTDETNCLAGNPEGGSITFDFCQPVVIEAATLLIDGNTKVIFHDETATSRRIYISKSGAYTKEIKQANVMKLEISMAHKTGVSSLAYSTCPIENPQ